MSSFLHLLGTCASSFNPSSVVDPGSGISGDPLYMEVENLLRMDGTGSLINQSLADFSYLGTALYRTGSAVEYVDDGKFQQGLAATLITSYGYSSGAQTVTGNDGAEDWYLGKTDFTIEAWIRIDQDILDTVASSNIRNFALCNQVNGFKFGFRRSSSGQPIKLFAEFTLSSGSVSLDADDDTLPSSGVWVHIAFERKGNNYRIYQNGVMMKKISQSGAWLGASPIRFMHDGAGGLTADNTRVFFDADNIRVTRAARYDNDSGFSVPTQRFPVGDEAVTGDPYWSDVKALFGAGNHAVNSTQAFNIQLNRASSDFTITNSTGITGWFAPDYSLFETTGVFRSTAAFNGAYSNLVTNDSESVYKVVGKSFTVELWFQPVTTPTGIRGIHGIYITGTNNRSYSCQLNSSVPRLILNSTGLSGGDVVISGTTALQIGEWYFLAFEYDAEEGEARVYVNGVMEGKGSFTGPVFNTPSTVNFNFMSYNGNTGGSSPLCFFDQYRFTWAARYKSDDGHTVPTGRFPCWEGDGTQAIPKRSLGEINWKNPLSSGDRRSMITLGGTDPFQVEGNRLLNGDRIAANTTTNTRFTNGLSNQEISFDFGTPHTIQGLYLVQSSGANHGNWKVQASEDNSSWVDLTDPIAFGATNTSFGELRFNETAYRYYRLLQVSGTTSSTPFLQEILFKIDDQS